MIRWASGSLGVLWALMANSACFESDPFQCTIDAQCTGDADGALCQQTGFCSFPDDTCPSGQRYGGLAGDGLANECVELDEPGSSTEDPIAEATGPGQSTTPSADSSDSGMADSTTAAEPMPPCGAPGQPCCDGVCDSGAVCTEGACEPCTLQLDIDEYYSCATRSDGVTACWGADDFGQLGDGATQHELGSPDPVVLLGTLDSLDLGAFHGCGTGPDGVLCWGRNSSGQLGLGSSYEQQPSPLVAIPADEALVVDLAAGSFHTCALSAQAEVFCWGANADGQLGDGGVGSSSTPRLVPMLGEVVDVAAGAFHTCVLDAAGVVTCWGRNDRSELGTPGPVNPGERVVVDLPPARALTVGDFHGCIIAEGSDEVWCWGANELNQTGEGAMGDPAPPHPVLGVTDVQAIDAGDDHTCVITPKGAACWGNNSSNQLGIPGSMPTPEPQWLDVPGVTQIRGGREHTCLVTDEPRILCLGNNQVGQLGDGMFNGGPSPVATQFGCDY